MSLLSNLEVRNLYVSISELEINTLVEAIDLDIHKLAVAAEGHTQSIIGIWGDTNIGYMRALFDCLSWECDLEHVIVETNVVSRLNLSPLSPSLARIEYGFDLRSERIFALSVGRGYYDLPENFYQQFVDAEQLTINFNEALNQALQISEDSFPRNDAQYRLSITWANCAQVRIDSWCLIFYNDVQSVQYEFDVQTGTINRLFP
jgi:hypothetical protein